MKNLMTYLLMEVKDTLFPVFCLFCDTKGELLCNKCMIDKFVFSTRHVCHVCHKSIDKGRYLHDKCRELTSLDGVFIVVDYNDTARKLLFELKFNFHYRYSEPIADMIKNKYLQLNIVPDLIVPVPLHRSKKWLRGFNQAELIAKHIPVKRINAISRPKKTITQIGLNKEERINNLKNVFRVKADVKDKVLMLIDDVTTSGTTLEECAKVLKSAGAQKVYAIVWAHELDFS